jgi:steroid delta-isomerase-like uncharacterized protein
MRCAPLVILSLSLALPLCPAAAVAGTADNVQLAKRVFLETLAQGRFERLDEIYGHGFIAHGASADYDLSQDTAATRSWRTAMPDLKVTVERTVAAADLVAVHWKAIGTNTVTAGGLPGRGDRIGIEGMTFFRFAAGRIVEEWSVEDIAALRKQPH